MESFWSTLKLEMVYRQDFDSHEQARRRASPELPVGRRINPAEPIPTDPRQPRVPSLGIYVDNPRAAAGWGRSPRWKRSHSPLAHSAKADPPPSCLSGAGPVLNKRYASVAGWGRSPRWKRSTPPSRAARKLNLPQAYWRAQDPSRGAHANQPHTAASPLPRNLCRQPQSGAGWGRSPLWKRSSSPSRA
jgi:hypothetical protein